MIAIYSVTARVGRVGRFERPEAKAPLAMTFNHGHEIQ
jgi:hypothetical protein